MCPSHRRAIVDRQQSWPRHHRNHAPLETSKAFGHEVVAARGFIRPPQTIGMVERFNGRISDVLKANRFDSRLHLEQTHHQHARLSKQSRRVEFVGHGPHCDALRSSAITGMIAPSHHLPRCPTARPCPLEIVSAQPPGHIDDLANEIQPRHPLGLHRPPVQCCGIDAAQRHLCRPVAF